MHLCRNLQAGIGLIRAVYGKRQNRIAHVVHIIGNPTLVGFIHNMSDKVNAGFSIGTDFFCEGFLNEYPQVLLILNLLHIDHCFFSLQRQAAADFGNRNIIALGQHSPQRRISGEHLDLNMLIVYTAQFACVPCVNIVQVDSCTRFTQFCVGSRPLGRCLQISLKAFLTIIARNIKVNDNVGFRDFDIVELRSKNIFEHRFDILPLLRRSAIFVRILCRTVLANIIKERMLWFQINP